MGCSVTNMWVTIRSQGAVMGWIRANKPKLILARQNFCWWTLVQLWEDGVALTWQVSVRSLGVLLLLDGQVATVARTAYYWTV